VIDNALERIGERKLNEPTVRQQLNAWIEEKERAVILLAVSPLTVPATSSIVTCIRMSKRSVKQRKR
jgi:hypothetical protein